MVGFNYSILTFAIALLVWFSYIPVVYFACDSASELERSALLPFWGFPALTCFLCFSELVIFRHLLHIFSQVLELSLGLFYFILCTLFWVACDHGNSFLCFEE